jgi:acyl-CoA hydrolase
MAPIHCTADEAAAMIRTRDTIGFGLGPANPDAFFTALGGRDDWEDLVFGGALLLGYYTVLLQPGVSYRSGFFGPAERMMLAQGANVELVPGGFRQFAPILRRFAPRVMTAQAAPPGPDGRVNLSLHLGATLEELELAGRDPERLLVVEVNPNLPRTCSLAPDFTNTLDLDLIDVLVERTAHPTHCRPRRRTRPTRPSPNRPGPTSGTGPPCRSASAPCPTWWPPYWPRGPAGATGSTARCSPTG